MMTETVVNVQEAPNNNAAPNKPQRGNEQALSWIKINIDYFKTTPGLLKVAEFILGIFCMGLASPAFGGGSHFFLFVVTVSFIGTIIWIFIYLLGIREALTFPINWILTELVNTGLVTVGYFIGFILQLITSAGLHYSYYRRGAHITAGVFGLFNFLVYGFATYLLHLEWKGSRTNQ
ncbi:CKLF-like MARVEL transmembrane domain-containing protein 4 [Anthonomus grandis grandis]|uniref:CKLF-like MARVEL transmembrane domain-containing protein 4 n=1 Tax=Anthonomus grandis grandis TaxID=2921223 RepID=UPI00216509EC|nr:CKLF-like MARVEL transmembrane domain-containing protein 4 [Anthonomus grandis grandis]